MMAFEVIADERRFTQGTCCRGLDGTSLSTTTKTRPWQCDALGAILWAYKDYEPEARHRTVKIVFDTCKARYGHKMLSKLIWDQALDLLRSCGV